MFPLRGDSFLQGADFAPSFHPPFYSGGQSENFAENQPDTIRPLTFTHQRYIAPGRTRLQGGAGDAVSPPKKSYLSILGTEHIHKVFPRKIFLQQSNFFMLFANDFN